MKTLPPLNFKGLQTEIKSNIEYQGLSTAAVHQNYCVQKFLGGKLESLARMNRARNHMKKTCVHSLGFHRERKRERETQSINVYEIKAALRGPGLASLTSH